MLWDDDDVGMKEELKCGQGTATGFPVRPVLGREFGGGGWGQSKPLSPRVPRAQRDIKYVPPQERRHCYSSSIIAASNMSMSSSSLMVIT